jgi:amino acid adenylation domain-containing protein
METADSLLFKFEYCTKLFTRETIERFGNYLKKTVSTILLDPGIPLGMIEIISEEEKQRLLYDFNRTTAQYPKNKTIHELFEEQVEKNPDNIALIGEAQRHAITYKELNAKSNQLAQQLRTKQVKPGTIAAVMVERSIEMILGIFAVLKAGGAYLPIEPTCPGQRLKIILKDAGVKLLLSQDGFNATTGDTGNTYGLMDLKDAELYRGESKNLRKVNVPTDMAYVIYTSGSTGKPKGVVVEHISVINILIALQNRYPLLESDTYLLKTSYIFDVSVTELFGWFLGGGRLAILEKHGEKNPVKILNTIENQVVTHINFVPSMFNVFMESLQPQNIHQLSSLRYIFLAGEAIMPVHLEKISQLDMGITLENIYGPTEGVIYSSSYSLSAWNGSEAIPIGTPMPNIKLYILNKDNHLQPVGIPGELCIGGVGLARGYLNNPQLTNYKFQITNQQEPGKGMLNRSNRSNMSYIPGRLYKTGDLARWLPEGNIEFIGRIDNQVKVRGFRVELGEIENKLLKHDHIKEAFVSTGEMKHALGEVKEAPDVYLCAYFVSDLELTVPGLKEFLSMHLPDYMVPAYFVQMEKIPLTPSGKADRKALPPPLSGESRPKLGVQYVAPKSGIEKIIAETWKEVLKVKMVGIYDNFFDIGGNSLKLILANNMLTEALKRDIPVVKMFEYPTINTFLNYLNMAQNEEKGLEEEIELLDVKHDDAVNVMEQTFQALYEE